MSRNIKYQIFNAIESCFEVNQDKHSAKAQKEMGTHKIYSYADRNNLKDFGANLSNWLKVEHPDIKQVKDIDKSIVQEFINNKAKTVTGQTIKQYISKLGKLEKIINHRYQTANVDFLVEKPETKNPDKIRAVTFTREEYNQVMQYYKKNGSKSQAVLAIDLAGILGLRVEETTQIMPKDLRGNTFHIHKSKGARSRNIKITNEEREYLKEKFKGYREDEYIVKIQPDSVNKSLSRTLEKLGIERFKKTKSGVHAIRKMRAQEIYDEVRRQGMSKQEAMNYTSHYLGHGNDRKALIEVYVMNLH